MKRGIIILGSSNSKGETFKISEFVSLQTGFPIIDLKTKVILPFDYDFKNRNDDFFNLIESIVENYDLLIFATPVYWYTMSGTMKIFFDRLSDCLKIYKDTGRKLRTKEMAVISSGSDEELKVGFHMPFIETAKYLGIKYLADEHCWDENLKVSNEKILNNFIFKLEIDGYRTLS